MKRALLDKWIEALESGAYKQGRRTLRNSSGEYCCLGVLCEVAQVSIGPRQKVLTSDFAQSVGMNVAGHPWNISNYSDALSIMNDEGATFSEIATILRERPLDYIESIEE